MEQEFHGNTYGKDENNMWKWVIILAGVVCVGAGAWLYSQKKGKRRTVQHTVVKERPAAPQEQLSVKKNEDSRKKLVDEYCLVNRMLDARRNWSVYRDSFLEIGPFLQLLLGTQRRFQMEGRNVEPLLTALQTMADNCGLKEKIGSDGICVKELPSNYQEEQLRNACEKVDDHAIALEIQKGEKWLAEFDKYLDCQSILKDCGGVLYDILQSIYSGDMQGCLTAAAALTGILEKNGCFPIYADDERVVEDKSLQVDFREDHRGATELPGFYTKGKDGTYHRIGMLGGTMCEG